MRRAPTGFYSVRQLADMTGISTRTLYKLVHDNHIPSVRLGNRILIPIDKWEQLVKTQVNQPKKPRRFRGRPPVFDVGEEPILAQLQWD